MSFLGKKLVGQFRGEVISDMTDRCKRRLPRLRIKHRAKMNWIKMYDKAGPVVRVEIVINQPEAFKFAKASDVVIGGEIKGQARFTFISLIPALSPFRNRRTSTSRLTPARCSFVKNPWADFLVMPIVKIFIGKRSESVRLQRSARAPRRQSARLGCDTRRQSPRRECRVGDDEPGGKRAPGSIYDAKTTNSSERFENSRER